MARGSALLLPAAFAWARLEGELRGRAWEGRCQSGLEPRKGGGLEREARGSRADAASRLERRRDQTQRQEAAAAWRRLGGSGGDSFWAAGVPRALLASEARSSGVAAARAGKWLCGGTGSATGRPADRSGQEPPGVGQDCCTPCLVDWSGGSSSSPEAEADEDPPCLPLRRRSLGRPASPAVVCALGNRGPWPSRAKRFATLAGPRMPLPSSALEECLSPVGLDCCSCCLDLANRPMGYNNNNPQQHPPSSPFQQLREQLVCCENVNADKLGLIMRRQDSLEPVVRDPCYLLNQGICSRHIDQTLLSILLFFHSASGASVVAIDNKIEQAMDLVKNHLMYAVREEVEILKEQIKELAEKNSQLERENSLLKHLASPEQLQKFQSRLPLEMPPASGKQQPSPRGTASGAAAPAQHRAGSAV